MLLFWRKIVEIVVGDRFGLTAQAIMRDCIRALLLDCLLLKAALVVGEAFKTISLSLVLHRPLLYYVNIPSSAQGSFFGA